jgi:hypothetical protein
MQNYELKYGSRNYVSMNINEQKNLLWDLCNSVRPRDPEMPEGTRTS